MHSSELDLNPKWAAAYSVCVRERSKVFLCLFSFRTLLIWNYECTATLNIHLSTHIVHNILKLIKNFSTKCELRPIVSKILFTAYSWIFVIMKAFLK